MRKKSTRLLSAALAVCMMLSVLPVGAFAAEPGAEEQENGASAQADAAVPEGYIAINEKNFPDENFRDYVAREWDKNQDKYFSPSEIAAAKWITCDNLWDGQPIKSLKGIEYFTEIWELTCVYNDLTEIDLSHNKKLEYLNCHHNKLEKLDVSGLPLLETFYCGQNKLQSIDVSKNKQLKDFSCTENPLNTLDVSQNTELEKLACVGNNLTELDVSKNKNLKILWCYQNKLSSLNLENQTELELLGCRENPLNVLSISANTKLKKLYVNKTNLTSLDATNNTALEEFNGKDCSYNIAVEGDGKFDLTTLPGHFDASKATAIRGGTINGNILTVDPNSKTFRYDYDIGQPNKKMNVVLNVHWHNYQWKHDGTKHWRECTTANCPGLTAEQVAKTTHDYTDAKDKDCNTCGYVRPLYTVTTVNATAKLESEAEELKAPVAAGTEVILTVGNAPEGKTFAGWKLYEVVSGTESEITDATEISKLLKNGTETTATLTMPAYNVKAEPYYSDIPYNIKAVNCTVDKTEAAKGDTVTATRRKPEANEHFTGWTVKVNGVEQDTDTFLKPDADDPAKVSFTMPAENVEIKANFEGNPTLNPTLRVGDHVTATIEGSDASVPSGSAVPVGETVHLTATVPDGQHFTGWTVKVGDEEQKADTFLTPDKNDPTKVTFTMPSENVEVTANFASNPTLNPTLRVGDHVTATIEGSDASVPSGSTVPVPKNKIVHLTATAPGQHFISWTVKVNGVEQDPTFLKPDADDPTKVTFTMPDANVEVTATFADDPIPEPDPVGPSDTGNIQGAISAVVVGAAAGAIIYEAGTGIYRVINMPGIPMPSNRIELAELLWEHAGKPEPVSTARYSDIDEGDTDAQKAARWAVEQDLMKDDADNNKFHPAFPVSKLRTCLTWNAAKEKGLFDKTEE